MFKGMIHYNWSRLFLLSLIFILVSATVAFGQSSSLNLSLPTAPGSYQSDKFRAGDLDCSNAIGSATNLEFGVTGILGRGYTDPLAGYVDSRVGDVGIFARITIPLGQKPKARIEYTNTEHPSITVRESIQRPSKMLFCLLA